jgi:hypothetical protein
MAAKASGRYVKSKKRPARLRELPVRVVRPGHRPSFGPRRLDSIIDRYLEERP